MSSVRGCWIDCDDSLSENLVSGRATSLGLPLRAAILVALLVVAGIGCIESPASPDEGSVDGPDADGTLDMSMEVGTDDVSVARRDTPPDFCEGCRLSLTDFVPYPHYNAACPFVEAELVTSIGATRDGTSLNFTEFECSQFELSWNEIGFDLRQGERTRDFSFGFLPENETAPRSTCEEGVMVGVQVMKAPDEPWSLAAICATPLLVVSEGDGGEITTELIRNPSPPENEVPEACDQQNCQIEELLCDPGKVMAGVGTRGPLNPGTNELERIREYAITCARVVVTRE